MDFRKAPCKGCENRYVSCHSNCGDYKEWKDYVDGLRVVVSKNRKARMDLDNTRVEGIRRLKNSKK